MGPRPKLYTHNGESKSIREWAMVIGVTPQTLANRMGQGHRSFADALAMGKRQSARQSAQALKSAYDHGEWFACGCEECRARRGGSKPRTQEERDARWRKEVAARQAAMRASR
jgi:hypothetical protein